MPGLTYSLVLGISTRRLSFTRYTWTPAESPTSTPPHPKWEGGFHNDTRIREALANPERLTKELVAGWGRLARRDPNSPGPGGTIVVCLETDAEVRQDPEFRFLPGRMKAIVDAATTENGSGFRMVSVDQSFDIEDPHRGSVRQYLRVLMAKECFRDMVVLTPVDDIDGATRCRLSHYQWMETDPDSHPEVYERPIQGGVIIDKSVFELTSADLQSALSFLNLLIPEVRRIAIVPLLLHAGAATRSHPEFAGLRARFAKQLGEVRLKGRPRKEPTEQRYRGSTMFTMVPDRFQQKGLNDAQSQVAAFAAERMRSKFAMLVYAGREQTTAWLYRWAAVDGMDGPRGLDLIEKVTIEGGITTSTADDTKLKAYLSPLTQLTQERLPTHAGHVSLILLETPVVQALSRHGTPGSYHTLCEALRACTGHNAQGSRSVVAACALIPGYGESEVNNDYYHTEVLRSFFVRRALVLENGKLRGNFNVSAYGLELIDSTAPLGHVKLYNKGRAFSRCILNFYEDEDEYRPDYISELTPAQLTELKEYRESKDVEQVRKVLTDAFNVARAWVSPLAEKIPVFFVDTVTPRETAQQARYDAGVKFAEEFARNWQYRGNPVLSVEFIVVPPRVYTGEEDPKWNVEDDDRERITRYYDRYAVVVVDTTAIVYNWQTWPVSDRALPPLAAISTWTTPTPTPANISTLLSSARDLLPTTHAGPVPVFVWTPPGVAAPTLDAISDLREAIDSPPAPGGATTFMLAEYAPVADHDIAFAASAAHEYELARAVTAADTPTPVVGVPRYAWCYSRDAAANMAGLMYSVVCLGTQVVVDVFVQRWPAVAAPEDVGGREVQLMDVLVPEGPEREVGESRGGMVGAALLWSAVAELGSREVKCHAANVYAISGDVGGEGLEGAVGKQAFIEVAAALRVLSEGFGMKVGGEVVDLGVDKWTMGRMALWATGTGRVGEKLW